MPTLHLPAAHTDTDIALAAELASIVGSQELYVTWTHGEGPGLPPEVQAEIHEEHQQSPLTPFAEVLVAMAQGIAALWQAILHPPKTRTELPAPRSSSGEPRTEEWSA
jgi:carbamate kinase